MGPTLLILAAGMGSRYGGLKQIDRFGPSGETIMDYAVYDALAAGFTKVVFVIRRAFEADFRKNVGCKYESRVTVDYVFQEKDMLPPDFVAPAARSKPWGTAHAIWCARQRINEPFLSVNADDYYGQSSYKIAAEFLTRPESTLPDYCLVAYPVLQTLSAHGAVARAVCDINADGLLKGLVERTNVERFGASGRFSDETGSLKMLQGDEVVSMNMLGFAPSVFPHLERHLIRFLEAQQKQPDNSECLIPVVIGELLKEESVRVHVLRTSDRWFGVTHPDDKPDVIAKLRAMVDGGEYPSPIWNNS